MDMTGEDEWSDWEDEEIPARSLLEDKMLPSAKAWVPFFSVGAEIFIFSAGLSGTRGCVTKCNQQRLLLAAGLCGARGAKLALQGVASRA